MFRFANPLFLILLIIVPGLAVLFFRKKVSQEGYLRYSSFKFIEKLPASNQTKYKNIIPILKLTALFLLIITLARPQTVIREQEILTEGVDIILALDISGSMKAEDFKPLNRLGAAKETVREFIANRKNDRIGLVVFSKYSFTQCPLTLDYSVLLNLLDSVEIGMIEDGTAIGMAIVNCVNRLKDSKAKSRVIILLTDGVNNSGEIDPLTAAQTAKAFGIKIYTVGAGRPGSALYPVDDPVFGKRYVRLPTEIDEKTLTSIAQLTGGAYFRAKDEDSLRKIYKYIGDLEKTEIETKQYTYYEELMGYTALPALILLLLAVILSGTIFRKIP